MSNQKASEFRLLHRNSVPLLLANAWDAASARLFEASGAHAVATTSAGVAWSLGFRDGRSLPVDEAISLAGRIAAVIKVPLSVDIENGYSDDPVTVAATVKRLIGVGVAGINIEDGRDEPRLLADKIAAIAEMLERENADVFVNARCDVFLAGLGQPESRIDETVRRGQMYASAGADGLFVPGLVADGDITAVASRVLVPLNVMAWPGLAGATKLGRLGVRRLSAGSAIPQIAWNAAEAAAKSFLNGGESDLLFEDTKQFPEMQQLFS
jgi:2-methylisocitrate lyase-like PEP mutase family enzyme